MLPSMCVVKACQTERVWKHSGCGDISAGDDAMRDLLGVERFAVKKQFGIELTRSPAVQYVAHCCLIHA